MRGARHVCPARPRPRLRRPARSAARTGPRAGPWLVPVNQLTAHPGNVREDLDLTPEFCASVAEAGVRIPLLVTPGDGGYRVIEGHRRLAAAAGAGLAEVPCTLDPARAGDDAGQYLDMAIANSDACRQNFTALQEASALFTASEAGATRTRIRKATGRSASQVKAALQAGRLSGQTRAEFGELSRQPNLDELALLAEFDGDQEATSALLNAITYDYSLEHAAERIRQDRAATARHDRLVAELTAAGVTVTGDLPGGARQLAVLTHDGEEITPDSHASCPGRGAFFKTWAPLEPVWYCASPDAYGHAWKYAPVAVPPGSPGDAAPLPDPLPGAPADAGDPDRRLVLEGNTAWAARGAGPQAVAGDPAGPPHRPPPGRPVHRAAAADHAEPMRAVLATACQIPHLFRPV